MKHPVLIFGGGAAALILIYIFFFSGGSSSETSTGGDLTVVDAGGGVVATDTSGASVANTGGSTDLMNSSVDLYKMALSNQQSTLNTNTLSQTLLDMYDTIIPGVDVTRGFTQNWTANVQNIGSDTQISVSSFVQPNQPNQDLVDQISHLNDVNTDNYNTINLLNDKISDLTYKLTSAENAASQAKLASEGSSATIAALTNKIENIKSALQPAAGIDYTGQKSLSKTDSNIVQTSFLSAWRALWA